MASNTCDSSVDNLINDIRELYNKSKTSSHGHVISCDMVDEKLSKRAYATQRQLARNVARASKQFEEMFRKCSFSEKMIEKSKIVHAPSCSTVSGPLGNYACSCEELKSESSRNLLPKKMKSMEMCSYGRLPQVFISIE